MAHIWEVEKIMAPHETPSNNDDDKKIPKFNNDIQEHIFCYKYKAN